MAAKPRNTSAGTGNGVLALKLRLAKSRGPRR